MRRKTVAEVFEDIIKDANTAVPLEEQLFNERMRCARISALLNQEMARNGACRRDAARQIIKELSNEPLPRTGSGRDMVIARAVCAHLLRHLKNIWRS